MPKQIRAHRNISETIMPIKEFNFWDKVNRQGDCWNWLGARDKNGYGRFYVEGKRIQAHRVSYLLAKGVLPDDMQVCHQCDNPSCVNPSHLFLGTAKDNANDRDNKNRGATAKLTIAQIEEARSEYKKGNTSSRKLADKYKVNDSHMRKILRLACWKNTKRTP